MSTEFVLFQGVYVVYNKVLLAESHAHQFIQLNLLQDSATVMLQEREYSAPCCIIDAHQAHQLISVDSPVITILVDNFSQLGKQLAHLITNHSSDKVYTTHMADCTLLWQYFNNQYADFSKAFHTLFSSLTCPLPVAPAITDKRVAQIVETLNSQPVEHIALTELAASVHLSTSRLSHLFSEQLGLPLKSYLRYVRFKHLLPLLAQDRDLTQAAFECGFSDAAHLSRECKKLFGIQPKQLKGRVSFKQFE